MKISNKALLAWGALVLAPHVPAVTLDVPGDDINASLDSVVRYSSIYRTSKTKRAFEDGANLGANENDGTEYYNRSIVSSEFKITSELSISKDDDGLFVRGSAWYDTAVMDGPSGGAFDTNNTKSSTRFPSDLENRLGQGSRLLDAYVYGNIEVGNMPVNVRLGRQVINWGEGIFYSDGVNVINPVDVGRIVLPSSTLREALLPSNMAYLQAGLTEDISVEGFYGLEWRGHQLIPAGSFYSSDDNFGKGSEGIIIDLRNELDAMGVPLDLVPDFTGTNGIVAGARYGREIDARDDGQFGMALRYVAEDLNSTEFSLYYINYHSKTPFMSIRPGQRNGCSAGSGGQFSDLCALATAVDPGAVPFVDGLVMLDSSYYDLVYPEDIRLFGFTVSGNIGDTNVAMELTYRPNAAVESSMFYEAQRIASDALTNGGASGVPIDLDEFGVLGDQNINLYRRMEMYTGSLSAIHFFGPALTMDGLTLIAEVATNQFHDAALDTPNYRYMTASSWGYTMNLSGVWEGAIMGADLHPSLSFKQDVNGISPTLNSNFYEGRKSATAALGLSYGDDIAAELSYTNFWGAKKDNSMTDRDHIAFNVSYSF